MQVDEIPFSLQKKRKKDEGSGYKKLDQKSTHFGEGEISLLGKKKFKCTLGLYKCLLWSISVS